MARFNLSPSRLARFYFHECDRYLRYAAATKEQRAADGIPPIELAVGPLMATDDTERVERQRHLQDAEVNFAPPLPFDGAAARAFAQVAAAMRRQGRKVSARSFDARIAAIAMATGLPLYTLNPDDYANIDGLQVMAVPSPTSR